MKKNYLLIPAILLCALVMVIALLTGMVFFKMAVNPPEDFDDQAESVSMMGEELALTEEESLEGEEISLEEEEASVPEETSVLPAEESAPVEEEAEESEPEGEPEAESSAPVEEESEFGPVSGGVPASPLASEGDPYPGLYAQSAQSVDESDEKVLYITFDSAPSESTDRLLSVLSDRGVKATFFVSGQNGTEEERAESYRKILEAGHTVGLQSYTQDYQSIYASVDDYLSDLNKLNEEVYAATGYQADLVRFPEGSANHYNKNICKRLSAEITRRGYAYHDWSVDSGNAEDKKVSADTMVRKVEGMCRSQNKSVIRFHDTSTQDVTVEALERIIDDMEAEGYAFRALDNTVEPFHFRM